MPYIGKTTDGFGIRERFTYLASADDTSVSGADANGKTLTFEDPEYVDVFLNGIRLKKGTDYNTSTANTIAGIAALAANDEIEVIVTDVFTLADMVSANTGGDFRGSIAIQKDSGVLSFGADKEITLTHVADTGLLLNGTSQLQFSDASQNITAPSATVLDINATDEIELNATLVDVNANLDVSGTYTGGGLMTTGGSIVIPDDGTIGSASDTNAIAISSAGVVTISTNTDSTSSTSGAIIAHSAGFADDVYIGDDLFVGGGLIDLKNTGTRSQIKFYCESSNAHAQTLQAAPHSESASNTLTLPSTGGDVDLVSTASTATLTNKTLTSPVLNTATVGTSIVPASVDGASLGSASAEFSDLYLADSGTIKFGNDQDVEIQHEPDVGLTLVHNGTGDNLPMILRLKSEEDAITANEVIASIEMAAGDSDGVDGATVAAGIHAIAEGTFSASANATKLVFTTGVSETAAASATAKMTLSSGGNLTAAGTYTGGGLMTTGGNIVIPDAGNIGSASDTDSIAIASDGVVTLTQKLIGTELDISGNMDIDGTSNLDVVDIDGAVDMASTLQVDGAITSSAGATLTTADNTDQLTLVSTDADANVGPSLNLYRNSGSPADSDLAGIVNFTSRNDNSQDFTVASVDASVIDVSDGTEDGRLRFKMMTNGALSTISLVGGSISIGDNAFYNCGAGDDLKISSDGTNGTIASPNGYLQLDSSDDILLDADGGDIFFRDGGTTFGKASKIGSDFGISTGVNDADMIFNNTPSGTQTESFRIRSTGFVRQSDNINVSSHSRLTASSANVFHSDTTGTIMFFLENTSADPYGLMMDFSQAAADDNTNHFLKLEDSSAERCIIYSDGDIKNHDNSYGSLSDERIKDNITDANSQWDDIKALKVRNFQLKDDIRLYGADKAKSMIGIIAQEAETAGMNGLIKHANPNKGNVLSDSAFGTVYEDGDDIPDGSAIGDVKEIKEKVKGVSYSVLYMKAIKALQEAMTRIETLESSNTALVARIKTLEDA